MFWSDAQIFKEDFFLRAFQPTRETVIPRYHIVIDTSMHLLKSENVGRTIVH